MLFKSLRCSSIITAGFALLLLWLPSIAIGQAGFVYVATNNPAGNTVIQYGRAADGSLSQLAEVGTGGLGDAGSGVDPLGSQDALALNSTASLLLVVNAGSNQLSSMTAGSAGLQLVSTVDSSGTFPNSVAVSGDLVYVLNSKGTPNISGFRLSSQGQLQPISGSTFNLPGGVDAAPHDIGFTPDGKRLIVVEGGTNQFDIFDLDANGVVTNVVTQPSAGSGAFAFRFGISDVLLGTEAMSASVSSYFLTSQDQLNVISAAVPDGQMATCWITVTANKSFAFVSNTGSGTISSYHVARNGTLDLAQAVAASLGDGAAPIDSAMSINTASNNRNGTFLYVQDSALGRVVIFQVRGASLHLVGSVDNLPTTQQGIAAQ